MPIPSYIELAGKRSLWIFATLAAHIQVLIDSPFHGRFERLDSVTLEVDFVTQIHDMAREQPEFRVELDRAGIALMVAGQSPWRLYGP